MSRTSELVYAHIPTTLPGVALVEMVASVHSLAYPRVEDGKVCFQAGPTLVGSPTIQRKVFFQIPGTVPDEGALLQATVEIQGTFYTVYLAVDQYNRQH